MNSSHRYQAEADDGKEASLAGLVSLKLQIEARADGSTVGPVHGFLPKNLRPLITGEQAKQERRISITQGTAAYEKECDGQSWKVTWALLSGSEDYHRLSCTIERLSAQSAGPTSLDSDDHIIDELPDSVVITDLEGRLIYANRSAADLLGVQSKDDLIGRAVWTFVHPEELATARREGRLLEGGKRLEYVRHHVVRQDGETVPVEIVSRRMQYRGEPAFLISAHDLTGLRTVEQALEESQQMFFRVFKTGPISIVVSRISTRTIVDANDAFCRLVGKSHQSVVNRTFEKLIEFVDPEVLQYLRDQAIQKGVIGEVEVRIRNTRGQIRTLLVSSSRIEVEGEPCMLSMATDITERKQAVLRLRESEKLFRTMADNAPVLIWISDTSGDFTYFNERWLEFTGRKFEEELRGGWTEGIHPDDRDHWEAVFARAREQREGISIEIRLRRHDGTYRWMLVRAIPRHLLDETYIGFIGSCIDITDRKAAEEKLLLSKKQAEDLTILKSSFLTNMTHEIRTPLTVILGFTSILRQGTRREYHRFVNLIERSGRRLLLMLDSVLDLAQLDAGTLMVEPSRHNLDDIILSVIATLEPVVEDKNLRLVYHEPDSVPYVTVDAAILARVLNNLLDNAIKFTEEGSVYITLHPDETHTDVQIRDTGIGIAPEFLPEIFDAFSQESTGIERTHQGSGLGMTVSKQLLELIGGDLIVQSEKGVGTTITVRLPM